MFFDDLRVYVDDLVVYYEDTQNRFIKEYIHIKYDDMHFLGTIVSIDEVVRVTSP